MSETTRKINIFVDGKQVENTARAIKDSYTKLSNSIQYMQRDTKEYIETSKKISQLKTIYAEHAKALAPISTAWDKIKDSFKASTLAFMASTAIQDVFQKITSFIPNAVQAFGKWEEKANNFSAITGVVGDDFELIKKNPSKLQKQATKQTSQQEII